MRKAEWGSMKNNCSVCNGQGHNRRSCPLVPEMAERYQKALDSGVRKTDIHKHLVSAYEENERRNLPNHRKPKKARRCSFCGETKHTRRNCPAKVKYRDLLYEANRCWRRAFFEDVSSGGFGVGCLIKIKKTAALGGVRIGQTHLHDQKVTYAVISEIPWDKMTFMAKYNGRWEYQTDYSFKATTTCGYPFHMSEAELKVLLRTNKFYINKSWTIPRDFLHIQSPATPQPPDHWLSPDAKVGHIEWLIDDLNASKLEDYGIISLARTIIKHFS
jgi:hypothetical protein